MDPVPQRYKLQPNRAIVNPTQVLKLELVLAEAPIKDRPTQANMISKRPYILATTQKVDINMLYDTGADLSCIDEKVFNQLKVTAPLTLATPMGLATAGYHHLHILGKIQLSLTIHGTCHRHPFFVVRNLTEPAILGIDFISTKGLGYNPREQTFTWYGDAEPWNDPKHQVFPANVLTQNPTIAKIMAIHKRLNNNHDNSLEQPDPIPPTITTRQRRRRPDWIRISIHPDDLLTQSKCYQSHVQVHNEVIQPLLKILNIPNIDLRRNTIQSHFDLFVHCLTHPPNALNNCPTASYVKKLGKQAQNNSPPKNNNETPTRSENANEIPPREIEKKQEVSRSPL